MSQNFKIDSRLREEIIAYCEENNLVPSNYVNSLLRRAFASDRFGDTPNTKKADVCREEPKTEEKPIIETYQYTVNNSDQAAMEPTKEKTVIAPSKTDTARATVTPSEEKKSETVTNKPKSKKIRLN